MIEMVLALILLDWAFPILDFLTDCALFNPLGDIFPHALPLLPPPNDMAFKVLPIPKCPTIEL